MQSYNFLKSGAFWSVVVLVIYNSLISVAPLFPNVIWITVAINILGVISATVFNVRSVNRAARASARAGLVRYK